MMEESKKDAENEIKIELMENGQSLEANNQLDPNESKLKKCFNSIKAYPTGSKIKIFALFILFLALMITIYMLIKKGHILRFLNWVQNMGTIGPIIISICIILSSMPVIFVFAIFEISSGFLFGVLLGVPLVVVSGTIGAILCYSICRYFFRKNVKQKIDQNPLFKKLDIRIRSESWKLGFLIRLSPLPIGWVNAFFSVTKIDFVTFVVTTFFGIIPQVLVGVVAGSTMGSLAETISGKTNWTTSRKITFGVEVIFFMAISIVLFFVGRKIVKDTMQIPETQEHLFEKNSGENIQLEDIPSRDEHPNPINESHFSETDDTNQEIPTINSKDPPSNEIEIEN